MNILIASKQFSSGCYLILLFLAQNAIVNGNSDCSNELGQNEVVPCGGPESFINLCGLCVGGTTGRNSTEGMDSCNVCGGDDKCIGCDGVKGSNKISDACGACLEPDDAMRDNCTKVSSVYPNVLDKAVDRIVTVQLRGAGLNPTNLPDVSCSLQPLDPQQQPIKIEKQSVEDGLIQLEITLSDKLGTFAIHCSSNTIGPLESGNGVTLKIVDSKQLCVTDSKPKEFNVDNEFQMELTIPSVKNKSNLLCFVRKKGQQTAEVVQAVEVTAGRVKCGPYIAKRADYMEWGAAYTWDAAIDGEGCSPAAELTVKAPPPVIQSAEFTDGLQQILIKFDHNVDGSENCKNIFSPDTLQLLGKGANCSFVGNSLIVILGKDPKLEGNSELKLLDNGQVYREQSDHSLTAPASGKVTITPPDSETSKPQYEVTAPKMICPDVHLGTALGVNVPRSNASSDSPPQVIRLSAPGGGQNLKYSWTVNYIGEGKNQGYNLKIWRSIRKTQTYLNKQQGSHIALNTSLLMRGIEYKVIVYGTNTLGMQGKNQQFSFQVMPKDEKNRTSYSQLVLKGPIMTLSMADYFVEASITTCDSQIMKPIVTCEWKIVGELSRNIELPKGRILHLHDGILQGGKKYNISSTCTSEARDSTQKTELTAWLSVNVQSQGLKARISKQEIVLGTGQSLELDATQSQDEDRKPGNLQFSWCCRQLSGGRCLLPQAGKAVTLESAFKDAFQEKILNIPQGSLPVGRYVFSVEVSKAGSSPSKAQTLVEVIPGMPAIVKILFNEKINYVNPREGVTVPAEVINTWEGCRMWWSVQQEPGYEYFSLTEVGLGDTVLVTSEEARDPTGREFTLVIPGPTGTWSGLKDNAVYKLRLSVFCPHEGKLKSSLSHSDFIITTNSPPAVKPLKVSPSAGEALRTKFTFSTEEANDAFSDYPLLYQYGYRITDQEDTHFFSTSNEELQTSTTLPCVSGPQTVIIPVLTVCDVHDLCTNVRGREIITTLPNNLHLAEIQEIGDQFSEYIAAQQYTEAESYAEMSLQTLKQLPNQTLYTAAIEVIESAIQKELKRKLDGLNGNPESIDSSSEFLTMSVSVLSKLPMSGATLQDLDALKDKIVSLNKYNHEIRAKYTSFPNRHTKLPHSKSRPRRSSGDVDCSFGADSSRIFTLDSIRIFLILSERIFKESNESTVLEHKEKFLKQLHKYMHHLCKSKEPNTYVETSIVQFSIQKLSSASVVAKVEYKMPDRLKGPPAINETGMISLGKAVANKYGPSGVTCLGAVHFPGDYLMDVAIGINHTQNKDILRASSVFEAKLTNVDKHPGKLDQPVTLKLPISSINIGEDKILKCATWQEGSWSTENCETEESTTISSQTYAVCKCTVLGYFTIIIVDAPTTTVATTTTSPPTTSSTLFTSTTSTTVESTTQATSTASTELTTQSSSTTLVRPVEDSQCVDLPPGMFMEGVPISNVTYDVSFRIEEDFKAIVGEHKKEFEQKIHCEILSYVKMPGKMIQAIEVVPGSIIVTVKLVDTDIKTAKEIIPILAQAIQDGKLDIHGLENQKLKIPKQRVTIVEPYRAEIRAKYTSFPNRHTKLSKSKSRHRRNSGDDNSSSGADSSIIWTPDQIRTFLNVSERVLKESNKSKVLEEKETLLKQLHKYMYHLCKSKEPNTYVETSIVQFSVQKLSSASVVAKTEYKMPDRLKGPPVINETGMISLGKAVANKYGPSGVTCLGVVHFPGDYLMDVAIGINHTQNKDILRASSVFEAKLTNVDKHPGKLDQPVTLKLPINSINIGEDKILKCATWQEGSWSTENCETEESTTISSQTYAVCKCTVLGYFTIIIVDAPTTTVATTTIPTTTSPPTTSSTQSTSAASTTVESTTQATSTASTELTTQSSSTTLVRLVEDSQCVDLPPGMFMEGVPISNVTYDVSFRIEEDFKAIIGEHKKEFEQKIRCEILSYVKKMPGKMIQAIEVTPGSIIVTVKLVDTDIKTAKEIIPVLAQAIQDGKLDIHGLENQKLKIPKQRVTVVEPYRAEIRAKYTSFPNRHTKLSKSKSRHRRNSGDDNSSSGADSSIIWTPDQIRTFLNVSERVLKESNKSKVLEEKETLLKQLHKYMYHLCKSKEPNTYMETSIVQFSVQKLSSASVVAKTEYKMPYRLKGPPAINETGMISLGKAVANKYGPSGVTCLGAVHFPGDYLMDVAIGINHTQNKYILRASSVFEAKLTNVDKHPGKLDQPVTLKLPINSINIGEDKILKCATWQEGSWSTENCETEESTTISSQTYAVCKCTVLGYFTIIIVDAPTTTVATTTIPTTTSPPTTSSTQSTSAASTTVESTTQATSTASTELTTQSSSTTLVRLVEDSQCVDLPPGMFMEGVPISNVTYDVSFRIEEDFKAIIGEHKKEFEQKIRCEILSYVKKMPGKMIQAIEVTPGSIIVTVKLVDTDIKTAKEIIPVLAQAIQDGKLDIHGLENQKLKIPKQRVTVVEPYRAEIRAKYTSFPNRHTKLSKSKSRHRRNSGDDNSSSGADSSIIWTPDQIRTFLNVSERVLKESNKSKVLEEKETLLKQLHKYMYHLCKSKEPNTYVETSIVQFSVQKLSSASVVAKTEYKMPYRLKGPPAINETGMISLGKAVANKYGPSGVTCLGAVHFPGDYLMDVAIGINHTQNKYILRASSVFEAKLTNVDKHPGKLDQPVTLKLPINSINIGEDKILKCATWQEGSWSTENCETEESTTISSQTYAVCKCTVLGYFTIIIVDAPTTTVATTTIPTTTSPPTTSSTQSTSAASTTVESTTQATSTASTELTTQSSSTTLVRLVEDSQCVDLPPGMFMEGVPISNVTYDVSFRIEEDFKAIIGEHKKEFEQKIRCEILSYVKKMPGKMIQAIEVAPGSIIVTVKLVDTDIKTAKEIIPVLAQAIQDGKLDIHGLENQKLKIPKQRVTVVEPYRAEKSNAVIYAVVGCVIFSIICIVSLVAGAVIIKRKQDTQHLRKQQIPTIAKGVPTYRQFQYENSIEGTEASLARYRRNYPTMGTVGTLIMGTTMGIGGTQMITFTNKANLRHDPQVSGNNQYLHPDMNYNVSQTSMKKKKKKQKHRVRRAGSQGVLLNSEDSLVGDQDSGIVDGCTNSLDDRNIRNRNRDKKNSKGSVTEFDVLPGTPTDDM